MIQTKATATEKIAAKLKERILAGEYAVGSPLRELELATEYQVSRHAIREVLRLLAAEGIAEYSSFRGVRVPLITRADVVDIYSARRFLECGVLARQGDSIDLPALANIHGDFTAAVEHADWQKAFHWDVQFHSSIVSVSRNGRLVKWHAELMKALKIAHLLVPDFQEQGLPRSVPQHAQVIVALAASDLARAAAALDEHLHDSQCLLLQGIPASAEDRNGA